MSTRKNIFEKLTDSKDAVCVPCFAPMSQKDSHLIIRCTFGRRKFDVKLKNADGGLATFVHLAEAIQAETDIPCEKQRLLFKGIVMDPPDLSGFSTLQDLNMQSGDQVLIVNSRRIGTDDEEIRKLEDILPEAKITDKKLQDLFHEMDRVQRGYYNCKDPSQLLENLRIGALALEKDYMRYIQIANALKLDYRNAVGQARCRDLIDTCQRQMDRVQDFASSIFDRLALTHASVGGTPVLKVAFRDGPCPRTEKVYEGPCN